MAVFGIGTIEIMEPQLEPPPAKPRRRVPRYVYVGIILATVVGAYAYFLLRDGNRLEALHAELDRDDPGWRMGEIWSNYERTIPPDDLNPMLVVEKAHGAIPPKCFNRNNPPEALPNVDDSLEKMQDDPVGPGVLENVRLTLLETSSALELAHTLRNYPSVGGGSTKLSIDGMGTLLPYIDKVHRVQILLNLEGEYAAQTGNPDRAFVAAICCFQAGRAIGNEPFVVSQSVRRMGSLHAIAIVERALARGVVRAELLADLQDRLRDELDAPSMYETMRMERASVNQMYDNFRQGKDSIRAMAARYGLAVPGSVELQSVLFLAQQRAEHVAYLEYLNAAVEVTRVPENERLALAAKLPSPPKGGSIVSKLIEGLGGVGFPFEKDLTQTARIRCAIAGLNAERERMRTGEWPGAIGETLNDPFTGNPLKVLRTEGGFVVYSVGPDGEDNAGKFWHTLKMPAGHDIGFRLVDANRRTK